MPKNHCNSNEFGSKEDNKEFLLATPSTHPPFLPKMVLSGGYSVHKSSLCQG